MYTSCFAVAYCAYSSTILVLLQDVIFHNFPQLDHRLIGHTIEVYGKEARINPNLSMYCRTVEEKIPTMLH